MTKIGSMNKTASVVEIAKISRTSFQDCRKIKAENLHIFFSWRVETCVR